MLTEKPPTGSSIQTACDPDSGDVVIQFSKSAYRTRAIVLIAIGACSLFVSTFDLPGIQEWQADREAMATFRAIAIIGLVSGPLLLCCVERVYLMGDLLEWSVKIGKAELRSTQILADSIRGIRKQLDYTLERSEKFRAAAWFNETVIKRSMIQIEYAVDDRRKERTFSCFRNSAERDWMYKLLCQWYEREVKQVTAG